MAKLGDYASFIMGQAPSSSECNSDGIGTPFVKAGQFGVSTPIINEWTTNPLKMASDKDVLICVVGATSGKLNCGVECAIGRSVAAIRPNEKATRDYIYYGLHPWIKRLRGGSQGSAIGVITKEMLDAVEMPFPEEKRQKEIVITLSLIEGIIRKRKEELEKLDEFIKARFVEMFGSIHNNTFGYDVMSLQDVCEPIKDGTHQTPTYTDDTLNGYMFLSSKDVTSGKVDWNNLKYIPEELHNELYKRISPRKGDILLAKNGTTGVAAIVDRDEVFDIYVSLALLRPLNVVTSEYLCAAVNSVESKHQFDESLKGIGVPNLHLGEIKKTKIIVPPLERQNEFADFVKQVDKSKIVVQKSLDEAQLLFDSLMQEYFG